MPTIGDVRFEIEWLTLKPSAEGKEDIDFDDDLVTHVEFKPTLSAAKTLARKVYSESFAGVAQIRKQIFEINEDAIYPDWEEIDDMIEVSG